MQTQTDFPHSISEQPTVWITLAGGCRLAARLWRPETDEPVPAILEYLPYRRRDGTTARDALTHTWFAGHGYACLRVDSRGNGDSDGFMDDEYTATELSDACEVIEWLSKQPWCNGNVGMMGISWGGFNSLQVAALQPPALKAIITLCSTDDRYHDDIHYKGGCLLNENLGWGATMLSFSSRPPDPAVEGARWREMWLKRLAHQPLLPATWLAHQTRDDYWRHGSVCEDYAAIKAATLAVGGWGDAYKNSIARLLGGLSAPAAAITGPWIHKYPHFAVPHPQIGFLQEARKWWDHWLKGVSKGAEDTPAWRAYVMDSEYPKPWYETRQGRWIEEPTWPPARQQTILHLNAQRQLTAESTDQKPGQALSIDVCSPHDTGLQGGEYCAIWMGPELPSDQRRDDALSVCFDSDTLPDAFDLVGAPTVTLRLQSDSPRGQIAVRLCDIHPDGASSRITYGVLNLCHHLDHANPTLLTPGETITITLKLDDIAWRIAAGHRLRLAISSSYWPLLWPAPTSTRLTLIGGELHLPIRESDQIDDECEFEPAVGASAWQTDTLREPSNSRRLVHDQVEGVTRLEIVDDFGLLKDCEHGLESGGTAREIWSIDPQDPLSATAELHWSSELNRPPLSTRTETFATMHCDETHFFLTARIEAWEQDQLIFEKSFEETFARNFL